jgi:hypothetical protein
VTARRIRALRIHNDLHDQELATTGFRVAEAADGANTLGLDDQLVRRHEEGKGAAA